MRRNSSVLWVYEEEFLGSVGVDRGIPRFCGFMGRNFWVRWYTEVLWV